MSRNKILTVLLALLLATGAALWLPGLYIQFNSPESTAYLQSSRDAGAHVYRVALSDEGRARFERALQYLLEQDLDAAAAVLEEVREVEPRSPLIYEQLGRVALLRGQRDRAEAHFTTAFGLASGDAYLESVLGRWIQVARSGHYDMRVDQIINRQFPGQLGYFIEHRARPAAEGFLGASHLMYDGRRYTFPTPVAVPFELLARAPAGHGTIVFGSSRAREGFRAFEFEAAAPPAFSPAVNFASSQSAPLFWNGVLDELERKVLHDGRKLRAAIVLADPESLADAWSRPFKGPDALNDAAWTAFATEGRGVFELWPRWTGLTDAGPWSLPDNWQALAADPFANGLNHARQGTAYRYAGAGPRNSAAFKRALERLAGIAKQVFVVAVPLSPQQFELVRDRNGYAEMQRFSAEAGVPFELRAPAEWGLDERHFFGAKAYALDKMDWWHLNYPGARLFSKALAEQLRSLATR